MTGSMLNVEPSIANAVPVESITEKHWQSVTYQYSSRRVTINAADLLRAIGQWCPEPGNGERMYCCPSDVIPLMIRCGILAARHRCQPPGPPAMHQPPQPLHASPFSYTHPRLPPHRGPAHPDCLSSRGHAVALQARSSQPICLALPLAAASAARSQHRVPVSLSQYPYRA